jgi:uncharacterized membrane protein
MLLLQRKINHLKISRKQSNSVAKLKERRRRQHIWRSVAVTEGEEEVEVAVVDELAVEREEEAMVAVVAVEAVAETMRGVVNGTLLKVYALCAVNQGISAIIALEQMKYVSTLNHVTHGMIIIVAAIKKESIQHWLQQIIK